MKKQPLTTATFMFPFSFSLLFLFGITIVMGLTGCSDATSREEKQSNAESTESKAVASSIEGNWQLVWGADNGVVRKPGNSVQFKMFHDGYFALFAHDSAGKLSYAGYGKYELQGNTYKETFLWHNNPEYIGGMDWQEYDLKGDTLYFKGFNKLIVQGKERTDFPKIEEKRVRAK